MTLALIALAITIHSFIIGLLYSRVRNCVHAVRRMEVAAHTNSTLANATMSNTRAIANLRTYMQTARNDPRSAAMTQDLLQLRNMQRPTMKAVDCKPGLPVIFRPREGWPTREGIVKWCGDATVRVHFTDGKPGMYGVSCTYQEIEPAYGHVNPGNTTQG